MKIIAAVVFAVLSITACVDAPPTESEVESATTPCPSPQGDGIADVCEQPPSLPSCASLGCPFKPSGTPLIWTPCTTDQCYCGNPAHACFQ